MIEKWLIVEVAALAPRPRMFTPSHWQVRLATFDGRVMSLGAVFGTYPSREIAVATVAMLEAEGGSNG